jgi:hypothetical protein
MTRMIKRPLFLLSILISSCMPMQPEDPVATQLQTREIQTRNFDTQDTKLVMKSMMNVLQDEGYMIKNAVIELGLLSAEKNLNIENKGAAFIATLACGANARWSKQQIIEASANISEFGLQTRVRINFQIKTFDNLGCVQDIVAVNDPLFYCSFFEKVSKGIFLEQQEI